MVQYIIIIKITLQPGRRKVHAHIRSAENYLEAILVLENRLDTVRSVDIARELGFQAERKRCAQEFHENGYVTVEGGAVKLSGPENRQRIRPPHAHRRILTAPARRLPRTKADACRIEHDIGPESYEKLDEFMKDGSAVAVLL